MKPKLQGRRSETELSMLLLPPCREDMISSLGRRMNCPSPPIKVDTVDKGLVVSLNPADMRSLLATIYK